jgi:16S rRNA (guanine527-N7)-methyltransferase
MARLFSRMRPLPEGARGAVARWVELLCTWNARIDLTAARSGGELVDLLLADAAVLAEGVPEGASLVDVGVGAGAPGLALALLRPDLRVTLCEPMTKRVSFLRTVVGSLGRTDVALVGKRGEELEGLGAVWDVAISRATLPPPSWLALGAKLVGGAGSVWVLLAAGDAPELAGAEIAEEKRYEWPETSAQRRAVRYVFRPV